MRLEDPYNRYFDYKGLATDDDLENLESEIFADRSISIGRYVTKDSCPQLRTSPEAAVAAAKRHIRRLIKRDHEVLGFKDMAEVDNVKDGGYRGRGEDNVIFEGYQARGSLAATSHSSVGWKRSWRDEEGNECYASITVRIAIMRVVPEVLVVES